MLFKKVYEAQSSPSEREGLHTRVHFEIPLLEFQDIRIIKTLSALLIIIPQISVDKWSNQGSFRCLGENPLFLEEIAVFWYFDVLEFYYYFINKKA